MDTGFLSVYFIMSVFVEFLLSVFSSIRVFLSIPSLLPSLIPSSLSFYLLFFMAFLDFFIHFLSLCLGHLGLCGKT